MKDKINTDQDNDSEKNNLVKNKDPFADREAEKYPNPIPSREFIS